MVRRTDTWRKRILIPLWTIIIAVSAFFTAIGIIGLVLILQNRNAIENDYNNGADSGSGYYEEPAENPHTALGLGEAAAGLLIGFGLVSMLTCIAEIIAFSCYTLKPNWFLGSCCLRALIWTAIFIGGIVEIATGRASFLSLISGFILCVPSILLMIYAAIHVHRVRMDRKRGVYAAPASANAPEAMVSGGLQGPPDTRQVPAEQPLEYYGGATEQEYGRQAPAQNPSVVERYAPPKRYYNDQNSYEMS